MNHYRCSDGCKITKSLLDKRVRKAKAELIQNQLNEHGFNFCEECIKFNYDQNVNPMELQILDCAHIQSVDSCQKNGHAEKAYDISNMRILCRYHHRIHDKTNLKFK